MRSISFIAIKGDHLENEDVFGSFKYIDLHKDRQFNTWEETVRYLFDHFYELAQKDIALRAIWRDGDWTMICDPEMIDQANQSALEILASNFYSPVLTFSLQPSSNIYEFAKYNWKKERHLYIKSGELIELIGKPLIEEHELGLKYSLADLAKQFGIDLEVKNLGPFIIKELEYTDELKKELLKIESEDFNENPPPIFEIKDAATFKKFPSLEAAHDLIELLQDHQIGYQIVDNSFSTDLTFGSNRQEEKELKLNKADFTKVDALLEKQAEEAITSISKDHYLFEFSKEELLDIIKKPDEWSKEDYVLAKHILNSQGKQFSAQQLDSLKEERLKDLSKPEGGDNFWTFLGYVFSICGGMIGMIIGWHLMTFKKILPNGEKVFNYNSNVRWHGKNIFTLGIVSLIVQVIFLLSYR